MKKELRDSPGKRFDAGKLRLELIDPAFLRGLAGAMGYGAEKYGHDYNWTNGTQWTRLYASLLRHLLSTFYGNPTDPESGLLHLDHAAAMLMFLRRHMTDPRFRKFDDRCETFLRDLGVATTVKCSCDFCTIKREAKEDEEV
jgi:hypothetical protein